MNPRRSGVRCSGFLLDFIGVKVKTGGCDAPSRKLLHQREGEDGHGLIVFFPSAKFDNSDVACETFTPSTLSCATSFLEPSFRPVGKSPACLRVV